MIGIEVGTRIIKHNGGYLKGKVVEYRKSHNLVVIEWDGHGKIGYTESMLKEALDFKILSIDKEYYRNEKLDELGI